MFITVVMGVIMVRIVVVMGPARASLIVVLALFGEEKL